jgi:hypothetical protein
MKGKVVGVLLGLLCALLTYPLPNALAYTIPNTCRSEAQNSTTVQCVLTVANIGDLMVAETQAQDAQSAGQTQIIVTSVGDGAGDTWTKAVGTHLSVGANCNAGNCFDDEIWYAVAIASGAITITFTYSQNFGTAGAQVQGEDFVGMLGTDLVGTGTFSCSSSCGSSYSTVGSVAVNSGNLPVSSIWTSCEASNTLTPASGYTKFSPASLFEGATEYGTPPTYTGVSPTFFSWFCSTTENIIIDVGAVFGSIPPVTKVVACTFTQIQCWWYPMFFYGVFAVPFLIIGKAGGANGREFTYLLLAGLTFCSMIQVQMNMTNIMMPMILSLGGIIYAVRSR